MGVGVVSGVSGVSGGTRSGGDEQTQIQNTFQRREHFTAIEGQGLHDTGSGCESRGLERERLEDRIGGLQLGGWQLGGGSWGGQLGWQLGWAVGGWQLAVGIGVDDWFVMGDGWQFVLKKIGTAFLTIAS